MASHPHEGTQQMLDRLNDGLVALDRDLVITHHNKAAAALARREGERLVGLRLWDVFPQYEASPVGAQLRRALADQQVVESEDYSPLARRWLWRRFYPGQDGVTLIFGESALPRSSETELRASLTRARESEDRYRSLLDGMAEGVVETTPAGLVLAVNRAFALIFGYDSHEDVMAHVANAGEMYANPEDRPVQMVRIAEDSGPSAEIEMVRKDGTHVWVRARSSPRRDLTGEVVSIQTIVEDITELRYSERELRQVSERIEERERALLAESVHDDPLQLIVAALLRIDTFANALPPSQAQTVEQIAELLEQAIERLRQLITALTPPDLTDGLGGVLFHAAEGIFVGTSTEIQLVGPRHVPLIPAVKVDCYRVMREALVNARKHANAVHVTIDLNVGDDSVTVSVTDDGEGVNSLDAGPGHLGMGLMRARAEALGGRLQIESSPTDGTTVRLVVPRVSGTVS